MSMSARVAIIGIIGSWIWINHEPIMKTLAFVVSNYGQITQMKDDISSHFAKVVASSKIQSSSSTSGNTYVNRAHLQDSVDHAFSSTPHGFYTVVYGNKGVGKSELIIHHAIGKTGVVRIDVTSVDTVDDVAKLLFEQLGYDWHLLKMKDLIPEMKKVNEQYNIYPTIIFDVERSGQESQDVVLNVVRSFSKSLAHTCRCIIILSEANAVLQFGNDVSREKFIFVDEFCIREAKRYLQKQNYPMTDDELDFFFTRIGANPAMLALLIESVPALMTLTDFVEYYLANAAESLVAFPLQTILQALKDHPEGVPPRYFGKHIEKGVDLSDKVAVGRAMKTSANPIIYRIEKKKYELLSTAHRTAINSYEPIHPVAI